MRRTAAPAGLLLALLLTACSGGEPADPALDTDGNVLAQRPQTVVANPRLDAAAEQATADGEGERAEILRRLADVPTGIWLTPERYPSGEVGDYVTSVVDAADDTVPVFVVYGVPDRDCTGRLSAGGLTAETYGPWVEEVADAAGRASAVVLEPDALPGVVSCEGVGDRIALLREAVQSLDEAGVATYVDAGHSDWVPADRMAGLLEQVGVDRVRGFSTNVSNYQPLERERRYAEELSGLLDRAHYVIDTGRAGASSASGQPVDDWCNPGGQALGQEPGYIDDDTGLDALLWVKPPAESDGTCHGGPPAGEVWIDRAVSLGETAGW